ncbi:MAG: hypothetical protein LIP04_14085 [Tannerellaceae bacterium]|nr:hypothetical protein [Tannerellaceae bacterium]
MGYTSHGDSQAIPPGAGRVAGIHTIYYTVENRTTDLIKDEGSFQMMRTSATEGDRQTEIFNYLYPGESTTRSYTFRSLESDPFQLVYYRHDFFESATELVKTALKWKIEWPF